MKPLILLLVLFSAGMGQNTGKIFHKTDSSLGISGMVKVTDSAKIKYGFKITGDKTEPTIFLHPRYFVFSNVFKIDLDSHKVIWFTAPDSAGIVFAKHFVQTWDAIYDSMRTQLKISEKKYQKALGLARQYRFELDSLRRIK